MGLSPTHIHLLRLLSKAANDPEWLLLHFHVVSHRCSGDFYKAARRTFSARIQEKMFWTFAFARVTAPHLMLLYVIEVLTLQSLAGRATLESVGWS